MVGLGFGCRLGYHLGKWQQKYPVSLQKSY